MKATEKAHREAIRTLHLAIRAIRLALGVSELPAAWVDVLLIIAADPGVALSSIEEESGLATASAQRALLALSAAARLGRPGLGVIEGIIDPRHGGRKLYFLTARGQALMTEVFSIMTGETTPSYAAPTGGDFLMQFEAEQAAQPGFVNPKAFTPQTVTVGKRALVRRGISIGPHIVAFPLTPASEVIDEIEEWVGEQGGKLYRLPTIAKPDGMVIVDLPNPEEQVHFYLRWRGPV